MFCSYFLFDDDFVKERFNSHLGRFTKQKTQPVLDRILPQIRILLSYRICLSFAFPHLTLLSSVFVIFFGLERNTEMSGNC